jgi:hypothetical protein
MSDLASRIEAEADQQWIELEQVKRVFEYYDPLAHLEPATENQTREQEITVHFKNGKILVDFWRGNLWIDSTNIAAQIRRLPDVKSTVVHAGGNITVRLENVRNAAALPGQIATIARSYTRPIPEKASTAQLSLF